MFLCSVRWVDNAAKVKVVTVELVNGRVKESIDCWEVLRLSRLWSHKVPQKYFHLLSGCDKIRSSRDALSASGLKNN